MFLIAALESAPTTQLPQRLFLTALMILILVWAVFSIRKSWLRKEKQQNQIPAPDSVPEDFAPSASFSGRYLASTEANDWLARIVVHGLGSPSRAEFAFSDSGIRIVFNKVREIYIPKSAVIEIRADRAIAGRAFEKDGIAVIVWKLGQTEIASGFRADTSAAHIEFLQAAKKFQESGK